MYTLQVDVLGATSEEDLLRSPASSYKPLENIGICIVNDQYEGHQVLPIGTSAKKLHDLLKRKYGYKMLQDPYTGKTVLENKDDSIVDLLETMLTKWKEGEGTGACVDRFLLYYHGHGVQVSGQPCLLTPIGRPFPYWSLSTRSRSLSLQRGIILLLTAVPTGETGETRMRRPLQSSVSKKLRTLNSTKRWEKRS